MQHAQAGRKREVSRVPVCVEVMGTSQCLGTEAKCGTHRRRATQSWGRAPSARRSRPQSVSGQTAGRGAGHNSWKAELERVRATRMSGKIPVM